jgi:hypothetical protein
VNYANKYQPYRGYHAKPWLSYGQPGYGRRIRTRSDWHYDRRPWRYRLSKSARAGERSDGRRWAFWHRASDNGGSVYEKCLAHRAFRRLAKQAIQRELAGEDTSHNFRYCGDWLD